MIWLKIFIFTIWFSKRGGTFSRPFSGKMNSLKIKHLKKIHFFLVSEYGNLTDVKTHRDRLKNLGKALLNKRSKFFDFGRGWGPHKCFRCCPVVTPFILLFVWPMNLRKFSRFYSRLPFLVFTLESCSFFPFPFFLFFLLSHYALENWKFISKCFIKIFG